MFVSPDHGGAGNGVTLVSHAGGGKGAGAQLALALPQGVGAVVLANLSSSPLPRQLALRAVHTLVGLPTDLRATYPEHTADAAHLARLVGTHRWNDGEEGMRFGLHDGVLRVHVQGRVLPCRLFAEDGALICGPDVPVRFLLGDDGAAWALFDGAQISRRTD